MVDQQTDGGLTLDVMAERLQSIVAAYTGQNDWNVATARTWLAHAITGILPGQDQDNAAINTALARPAADGRGDAGVDLRLGLEEALRIVEAVPATVNAPRVFPAHEDLTSGGRNTIVPTQTIMITRQTGKGDLVAALRARLAAAPPPPAPEGLVNGRHKDLVRLLNVLGLGDHARPMSPAKVFDLCLEEICAIRAALDATLSGQTGGAVPAGVGGKLAPVQGFSAGIPWSMHLRAWDAYAARYGRLQTAERLAERGGFGCKELDKFIPGWRDELSEMTQLRAENKTLRARLTAQSGGSPAAVGDLRRGLVKKTMEPTDAATLDRDGVGQGPRSVDGVKERAGRDLAEERGRGGADGSVLGAVGTGQGPRPQHGEGGLRGDQSGYLDFGDLIDPNAPWNRRTAHLSPAARDVLAERRRQIEGEGRTLGHDRTYTKGQLADAAASYAIRAHAGQKANIHPPVDWPWDIGWWKPGKPRRMLVKAGALILAEIDRLDGASRDGEG